MTLVVERTKPFLKWAGGKARSAAFLAAQAPADFGRYWEPFLGSGAVFFELSPQAATLSDANEELVICFQEVARDPQSLMDLLDDMPNTREDYLEIRSLDPRLLSAVERAARVIYLNKTGFRGLWRVNRAGGFNVPYGAYDRPYYNHDAILRASKALTSADVRSGDFSAALLEAEEGDWVYLDPPYVPDRPWGDFRRYTPNQFPNDQLETLASLMAAADSRGVYITMTNSATPLVRELFSEFHIRELATRRDIHLKAADRASIDLVVSNFEANDLGI